LPDKEGENELVPCGPVVERMRNFMKGVNGYRQALLLLYSFDA
jgi:hypothetical protein